MTDIQVEEPKEEPTPENAAQDILSKLKELGIDSPDKIDGMATASQQAGNLANQLGEARSQIAKLQSDLGSLKTQQPNYTDYDEGVDLGTAIQKELGKFWNSKQEETAKANQAYLQTMASIRNDSDFKMVENIWNKHLSDPQTQMALQAGTLDVKDTYNKLVRTFYRESLKQSKSALEGLVDKKTKPPHVEAGSTQSVPMPSFDEDKEQKIKNITDPSKGWEGTDRDIQNLVKTFLPANDTIFDR